MSKKIPDVTKAAYSDPEIVAEYIAKHSINPKMFGIIDSFAKSVPGRRILDLGCGPGHDAYHFAELGFEVTGIDYSPEMIRAAQHFKLIKNPPHFVVADMRQLDNLYEENYFDGVWASASLIHIPQKEVSQVIKTLHKIVKGGGKVYIGVKGGAQGEQMVIEKKYGKILKREFTFWEKDKLEKLFIKYGYTIDNTYEQTRLDNNPTPWLNFFLTVNKNP